MDIQGKVIAVLDEQRFVSKSTGNESVKYGFVIETAGDYPKKIAFSVWGSQSWSQMGIVVGGLYGVSFDIESREWNGRWFTEAKAWKVVRADGQPYQQNKTNVSQPTPSVAAPQPQSAKVQTAEDDSELPF